MKLRILIIITSVLTTSCFAQDGALAIASILDKAHQSGSLGYWSPERCGSENDLYPSLPRMTRTSNQATALTSLQELFANDPRMNVTEDSKGMLRMLESDVPIDILSVRISHVSFNVRVQGSDLFGVRIQRCGAFSQQLKYERLVTHTTLSASSIIHDCQVMPVLVCGRMES